MLHWLENALTPRQARGRLTILFYHRAMPAPDPLLHDEIDAATFERHMQMLASWFNVLPLGEACSRLAKGSLPPRAVCITFDDGYADNERHALPILERYGLTATFFIATGYTGGGCMFNDAIIEAVREAPAGTHDLGMLGLGCVSLGDAESRRAVIDCLIAALKYRPTGEREALVAQAADAMRSRLPAGLMMDAGQIARLHRAGMEIGAHTVRHPILAAVDDETARREIADSKRTLEDIIGARVSLFAYPNGKPGRDYAPRHVRFVREAGFRAAVSTVDAVASRTSDPFQLPRHGPWERRPRRLAARLMVARLRSGTAAKHAAPGMATNG